eukprot:COSAG06_NODE_20214_length_804_cov_0.958865_2_plen_39_part_01
MRSWRSDEDVAKSQSSLDLPLLQQKSLQRPREVPLQHTS